MKRLIASLALIALLSLGSSILHAQTSTSQGYPVTLGPHTAENCKAQKDYTLQHITPTKTTADENAYSQIYDRAQAAYDRCMRLVGYEQRDSGQQATQAKLTALQSTEANCLQATSKRAQRDACKHDYSNACETLSSKHHCSCGIKFSM